MAGQNAAKLLVKGTLTLNINVSPLVVWKTVSYVVSSKVQRRVSKDQTNNNKIEKEAREERGKISHQPIKV
jgi:hypothetical protein